MPDPVEDPLEGEIARKARVRVTLTDEFSFALGGALAEEGYAVDADASDAARTLLEDDEMPLGLDLGYIASEADVEIEAEWIDDEDGGDA